MAYSPSGSGKAPEDPLSFADLMDFAYSELSSDDFLPESGDLCFSGGGGGGGQWRFQLDDEAVPRAPRWSLAERMLRALSLFKESAAGSGILAQVWVPVWVGEECVLSTSEQPYLLDHVLAGYREASRSFTFAVENSPGSVQGLPGRVFGSKMLEWTSNVGYYSRSEFARGSHALLYEVRGALAVPVLDPYDQSCCAVLELVTTMEKPNFDPEIYSVCSAVQAVDLKTATARVHPPPQNLSNSRTAAFSEIVDVLRAVCHSHSLPLALTWVPCPYFQSEAENAIIPCRSSLLCIQEAACYVNDKKMSEFVHACAEHHLKEGQGIAGKALQSNHPFFCPDVRSYNILEYPLVHHARKFGLNSAVAIRLRSTYTGDDDYILEFFLPISCKDSEDQQMLLNNLSSTMQRICRSLRTVTEAERNKAYNCKVHLTGTCLCPPDMSNQNLQHSPSENGSTVTERGSVLFQKPGNDVGDLDIQSEQASIDSRQQVDKKRSTAERNISLSVLQQYFSGSLKDAAKSIGVCPTTLKRICRQHGISRWPSRKINKVNRSLRKIQLVMDSVKGVEGALKYDPVTGTFVTATSILPGLGTLTSNTSLLKDIASVNQEQRTANDAMPVKPEGENDSFMSEQKRESFERPGLVSPTHENKKGWPEVHEESKFAGLDLGSSSQFYPKSKPRDIYVTKENSESFLTSRSSCSIGAVNEMDIRRRAEDEVVEHHQPSSSSTTDSSNGFGSTRNNSSSSSLNLGHDKHAKCVTFVRDDESVYTVKATYNGDTVRFKFMVSMGCYHLFDEIGKRFKLNPGLFQLKYLDDEDEWVMLVTESDLQECIDIMESAGSHSIKLMVRDQSCTTGSSVSSNGFL